MPPRRQPRKDLMIRKCKNGDLVFDNLMAGDLDIADEFLEQIKVLSAEGRMWPYKVIVKHFDKRRRVWVAKIIEEW